MPPSPRRLLAIASAAQRGRSLVNLLSAVDLWSGLMVRRPHTTSPVPAHPANGERLVNIVRLRWRSFPLWRSLRSCWWRVGGDGWFAVLVPAGVLRIGATRRVTGTRRQPASNVGTEPRSLSLERGFPNGNSAVDQAGVGFRRVVRRGGSRSDWDDAARGVLNVGAGCAAWLAWVVDAPRVGWRAMSPCRA